MEENHIYQFSLLNALMSGVSETGITASALLSKSCNQGLGTFSRMDGELVLLGDKIYQLKPHGVVREADAEDQIPFATITNFVPQQTYEDVVLESKVSVDRELDRFDDHAKNLFMTYRIEGVFSHLKCRTVRGQEYKGQPLSELGEKQSVEEYDNIEGTIIGFRSPENWQGFSVAGDHMHFISSDRSRGGHILELKTRDKGAGVTLKMAVVSNVHIELPTSEDFNAATLETDSSAVKKVEG